MSPLDLRSMPHKTLEEIMSFIFSSIVKYDIDQLQLTSFCTDNAAVNLGGCNQAVQNDVFITLLSEQHVWFQSAACTYFA